MLKPDQLQKLLDVENKSVKERTEIIEGIQETLNAHPAGQKTMNVPMLDGKQTEGMQHKYRETLLFFPKEVSRPLCHQVARQWLTSVSTVPILSCLLHLLFPMGTIH
jgi:L-lysine 2,3-aminomutase